MIAETINHTGYLSLVKQIERSISRDIATGALKRGQKLISINEYSRRYSVARDTIEKAYSNLKREGYITSVSGKGYFVIGKTDTKKNTCRATDTFG